MIYRNLCFAVAFLLSAMPALRAELSEELLESSPLPFLVLPASWSSSECKLSVSSHKVGGEAALCMHVPVDYHTGEKQYPIGWPRMYATVKQAGPQWLEYDFFEFQFLTESSRTSLPERPLLFHFYDAQGKKKVFTLEQAAIGEWRTFRTNLAELELAGPVTRLGCNINEADYNHKDTVTFHLGGFRLVRPKHLCIEELRVQPVAFTDAQVLQIELTAIGPADKFNVGVPLRLCQGDSVALEQVVPLKRGGQTIHLSLQDVKLVPGEYFVSVDPGGGELAKKARLTLVASPWQP